MTTDNTVALIAYDRIVNGRPIHTGKFTVYDICVTESTLIREMFLGVIPVNFLFIEAEILRKAVEFFHLRAQVRFYHNNRPLAKRLEDFDKRYLKRISDGRKSLPDLVKLLRAACQLGSQSLLDLTSNAIVSITWDSRLEDTVDFMKLFNTKKYPLVKEMKEVHKNNAWAFANTVPGKNSKREIQDGSVGAVAGRRAIAQSNSAEFAEAICRYTAPEELKAGGAIPTKGKKVSLIVKDIRDLGRHVIKSDTASVIIPEIDLELGIGTLGGAVTTVEGVVTKISEALESKKIIIFGDSLEKGEKEKWQDFRARLVKLLSLEEPWTLIMDDALANSFIAPACDDIKDDQQLTIEEYERSWEQNEELGLNDMDTSPADTAYNSINSS